jgi:hypothetical protein
MAREPARAHWVLEESHQKKRLLTMNRIQEPGESPAHEGKE